MMKQTNYHAGLQVIFLNVVCKSYLTPKIKLYFINYINCDGIIMSHKTNNSLFLCLKNFRINK